MPKLSERQKLYINPKHFTIFEKNKQFWIQRNGSNDQPEPLLAFLEKPNPLI